MAELENNFHLNTEYRDTEADLGEVGMIGQQIREVAVINVLSRDYTEQEDDGVHHTTADVNISQVKELTVYRLPCLVPAGKLQLYSEIVDFSPDLPEHYIVKV